MIIEAKITELKKYTTKPDGTPLVSAKTGRPYTRLTIKTDVTGDDWVAGFDGADTKNWKVGDDIEIDVTKNGQYSNFSVPKKGAVDGQLLKDVYDNTETILNKMVGQGIKLDKILELLEPKKKVTNDIEYPTDEPNPDDVPF